MKKSILTILILTASLLVVAAPLYADRIVMTTPELLISGGASINDTQKSASIKFTLQETLCYNVTKACFNPSLMWLVTENVDPTDDISDSINIGASMDLKYKFPKGSNNSLYIEVGPAMFIKELDRNSGHKFNLHAGAGVEYRRFILSADAYGIKSPLVMVNIGYRL